jgi:hypothetical protein
MSLECCMGSSNCERCLILCSGNTHTLAFSTVEHTAKPELICPEATFITTTHQQGFTPTWAVPRSEGCSAAITPRLWLVLMCHVRMPQQPIIAGIASGAWPCLRNCSPCPPRSLEGAERDILSDFCGSLRRLFSYALCRRVMGIAKKIGWNMLD